MSSEDSEVFENASADVLDLVQTVCDMIGEELQMEEARFHGNADLKPLKFLSFNAFLQYVV